MSMRYFFKIGLKWPLLVSTLAICLMFDSLVLANNSKSITYTKPFIIEWGMQPTTLDPHISSLHADHQLSWYIFDALFDIKNGEPEPILIDHYRWKSPTQWTFTLKKGVRFHDDSELTTADILASIKRAKQPENKFTYSYVKDLSASALDQYQFQIDTQTPNSELPWDLQKIMIINHKDVDKPGQDFNQLDQLNGTGPYRLLSQSGFKEFHFQAFDAYHRGQAYLQDVLAKVNLDEKSRIEHFLSGHADFVDTLSSNQTDQLAFKANIINQTGHFLYLMSPDLHRDQSPDIRDNQGQPMNQNPLKDLRVRQAISLALDRDGIIEQLYGVNSGAQVAGQLVNNNVITASSNIQADQQDTSRARELLLEAGYPEGFQLTLTDKDSRKNVLELIAVSLKAIGIDADVKTYPPEIYFEKLSH
ncbi:MAG: ABC transporter substrate-binding protein [Thiolinea sp.]